ncbi:MAG: hypothetical protein IJ869_00720 [Clostridiales bacterium]|nr:hypothetical protein [Clostridiales bacterium]
MTRKNVICPCCGADLLVDERKQKALCKNCGGIVDPESEVSENTRANETFIEKVLRYSGGKTTLIVLASIILVVFFFAGLSSASARKRAAEKRAAEATATEAETEAEETEESEESVSENSDDENDTTSVEDQLLGTYVGANGSVLILQKNGSAQYYYSDFDSMNSLNTWSFEDDTLEIYVGSCLCTVVTTIESGDVSSFTLEGKEDLDKLLWDSEEYVRVDDGTSTLTAEECDALIEEAT